MTRAVLTWVLERLERGESVAMASVIEASGSVPGKPGARLALTPSGARFGTIGGAGLELKVEDALRGMLNGGGASRFARRAAESRLSYSTRMRREKRRRPLTAYAEAGSQCRWRSWIPCRTYSLQEAGT